MKKSHVMLNHSSMRYNFSSSKYIMKLNVRIQGVSLQGSIKEKPKLGTHRQGKYLSMEKRHLKNNKTKEITSNSFCNLVGDGRIEKQTLAKIRN